MLTCRHGACQHAETACYNAEIEHVKTVLMHFLGHDNVYSHAARPFQQTTCGVLACGSLFIHLSAFTSADTTLAHGVGGTAGYRYIYNIVVEQ